MEDIKGIKLLDIYLIDTVNKKFKIYYLLKHCKYKIKNSRNRSNLYK